MNVEKYMRGLGARARQAAGAIAKSSTATRNQALLAIRDALEAGAAQLLEANAQDLARGRAEGLEESLLDRLEVTPARLELMRESLTQVASLADPVGSITDVIARPSGIQVGKMRMPLGVIGIVYESRPNVTVEAASLCLKAGNATILRGGSEALASNLAIARCITTGLQASGLPDASVQVVNTKDRKAVGELITMPEFVDVIVPRGGKGLIERISRDARVPVIKHLDGVCHVYLDASADFDKAVAIAINAKTQRYGACNTMETLLVDAPRAAELLPEIAVHLREHGVAMRGCERTCELLEDATVAEEADWYAEYLGPILAIRVVAGLDEAITHINRYGSRHTDAIVSEDYHSNMRFLREVDSSSVMINASTRFADGFEYGLGAEIGISTDKFHARGPVGLEGLTSQKFVVFGDGHIRQ